MRWVIGDIHGMRVALEGMVRAIDAVDSGARFYFVGDYVNRGPESSGVVEFLLAIADRCAFARGNHDDVFDLILNDEWEGSEGEAIDPIAACGWFLQHGLDETLKSYGLDLATVRRLHSQRSPRLLELIRATVPTTHRAFFRALPVIVEESGLFVAHAFWPPEASNTRDSVLTRLDADARLKHRVIWDRWNVDQIRAQKPWTRPGFFGHTPVSHYPASMRGDGNQPVVGPSVTLLDTAAALGPNGRLSAVCVEDGRLVQVDRAGRTIE